MTANAAHMAVLRYIGTGGCGGRNLSSVDTLGNTDGGIVVAIEISSNTAYLGIITGANNCTGVFTTGNGCLREARNATCVDGSILLAGFCCDAAGVYAIADTIVANISSDTTHISLTTLYQNVAVVFTAENPSGIAGNTANIIIRGFADCNGHITGTVLDCTTAAYDTTSISLFYSDGAGGCTANDLTLTDIIVPQDTTCIGACGCSIGYIRHVYIDNGPDSASK